MDLGNPMMLHANMERFAKDHYEIQVRTANAIRSGEHFEGGDDHTACGLGMWLTGFETSNNMINSLLLNIRQPHNQFHRYVREINDHLRNGNISAAEEIYVNQMMPAADEVFVSFNDLISEADRAVEMYEEMDRLQMEEAMVYLEELREYIVFLIDYNINFAAEEVRRGDNNIAGSNIATILAIIIGLGFAAILALSITKSITGGIDKGVHYAEEVADGNLSVKVDNELLQQKDEIGRLANALNDMIGRLREILGDILGGTDNIASASQQMSGTSQQMSQGASEQASSAEEVSSSMEQMVSNIQQNTDNAMQTEKIAVQSAEGIKQGAESTDVAVKSMKEIASKVSIIGDIAYQTNMLALNAAVEAARAGEHGTGFAVVAEEIRKLAERSQIAAEEIDTLSENGVKVSDEASEKLSTIVPEIEKTAKLVQEIAAASMEQNSGADQVNGAVQQLNEVIQQNAAAAEEMASSSEELSGQADQMKDVVSFFVIDDLKRGRSSVTEKNRTKKFHASTAQPANKGSIMPGSDKKSSEDINDEKGQGVDLKMSDRDSNDGDYQRF
ncbi:methyl-accepting chemotaxis protein [Marinilabiliaceae bacterium ANBcel2]|nr:methyl-accepting chemotaxis protein [Marinilabiliaceae bacterium ANBcel2]